MQGRSTPSHLTRRTALTLLAAAACTPAFAAAAPTPVLSPEDQADVDKAASYLEGLNAVKGRFTQFDARGRKTEGDFFLKRPGKVRFAYDPPSSMLLVSDGGSVSIWDPKLKTFESYPLKMTPLNLFLAKHVRLDKGVVVTGVKRYADGFTLVARDGKKEADGQIALTFSSSPMALREWTVTDAQNQATRVILSSLTPAADLDPKLFVLRDPRPAAGAARAH
jgi:outer membrane lipoprotein-sorting protein